MFYKIPSSNAVILPSKIDSDNGLINSQSSLMILKKTSISSSAAKIYAFPPPAKSPFPKRSAEKLPLYFFIIRSFPTQPEKNFPSATT